MSELPRLLSGWTGGGWQSSVALWVTALVCFCSQAVISRGISNLHRSWRHAVQYLPISLWYLFPDCQYSLNHICTSSPPLSLQPTLCPPTILSGGATQTPVSEIWVLHLPPLPPVLHLHLLRAWTLSNIFPRPWSQMEDLLGIQYYHMGGNGWSSAILSLFSSDVLKMTLKYFNNL